MGKAVCAKLERLGVKLIDGESVTDVQPTKVVTDCGRAVRCDMCVWSGGLRHALIARDAGIATDAQGSRPQPVFLGERSRSRWRPRWP